MLRCCWRCVALLYPHRLSPQDDEAERLAQLDCGPEPPIPTPPCDAGTKHDAEEDSFALAPDWLDPTSDPISPAKPRPASLPPASMSKALVQQKLSAFARPSQRPVERTVPCETCGAGVPETQHAAHAAACVASLAIVLDIDEEGWD